MALLLAGGTFGIASVLNEIFNRCVFQYARPVVKSTSIGLYALSVAPTGTL
jgi:hypothetical protein